MHPFILRASHTPYYWLAMAISGLAMFGIALYFQYALDYPPCVLCIQVRVGVLAIVLLALFGLAVRRYYQGIRLAHVLNTILMVVLTERAWVLLGTERGWIEGSCSMASGLPAWLALDAWFPALFGVAVPCGYTPVLWLGVTMAEALLVLFALGTLVSGVLTLTSLRAPRTGT